MLEEVLSALVRSQIGDLKRRTTGALLEAAALGMGGLAAVFLFLGAYVWLSARTEPWLAALLLALVATLVALVLMLVGRSLLRHGSRRQQADILGVVEALGLLSAKRPAARPDGAAGDDPGTGPVIAALAAGIVLGRSLKR